MRAEFDGGRMANQRNVSWETFSLVVLPEGLHINSQLLALLVEVAALKAQRPRYIGHVVILALQLRQKHFPFEPFHSFR